MHSATSLNAMRLCAAIIISTTHVAFTQLPTKINPFPKDSTEERLAFIAKENAACDSFSAEGLRFRCIDQTLKAYEAEIVNLNTQVQSNLCPEQVKSFKATARTWLAYYQTEQLHLQQLNECQGTNALYSTQSSLVQLLQARCHYLQSQLNKYRKKDTSVERPEKL
ncbi:MAG: hypothetical protein IPN71_18600 [Fibrobacteres bacterium]|nr:hypothetical protein [Fibrobacterota bacterium]